MKSLKNSNINPENLENLALIIPRDSRLAQSREIRDPVTRLESLVLTHLYLGLTKTMHFCGFATLKRPERNPEILSCTKFCLSWSNGRSNSGQNISKFHKLKIAQEL